MIAEIISVGTELLLGQIVDTNAAALAQRLTRLGIGLYHRTTVGDNPERIQAALRLALSRSDIIITIGGLGPTQDDLTKEMAAAVLETSLVRNAAHQEWLRGCYGANITDSFLKQADVPVHGRGLANPNGTALGALFEKGKKAIICLPGPPNEFVPMLEQSFVPYLIEKTVGQRQVISSRILRVVGLGESLIEERLRDLMQQENPTLAPYAKTGEVHLRITARAADDDAAQTLIAPLEQEIRHRLGNLIYGVDEETLEYALVEALLTLQMQIATAESCTGGLVAQRITSVPNASQAFSEGFVTYSNSAKEKYLSVSRETLTQFGAVSAETAHAMATGAKEASGANIAISITGIAGPSGGTTEKPLGLVYIGLATKDGALTEQHNFLGSRTDIRMRAAQAALNLARKYTLAPEGLRWQ